MGATGRGRPPTPPKQKASKNEARTLKRKRDQEDLEKLKQAVDDVVSQDPILLPWIHRDIFRTN